ncbi:MAG: transcription antitermination protein RfaH [marine bacterium B5-7]|nr:MAG: transcription antitermination protein RfaH [marine bacterium B5-7]
MNSHVARTAVVPGKSWYLIYCKPRAENTALTHLDRQNYTCYLPMLRVTRKVRGKLTDRIEPMFPRYLFISLDTQTDNWAPIRSTVGVTHLVRFGVEPTVVPDSLIQTLMDRENEEGLQCPPRRHFEKGEAVRIYEGPFKDYEGIFVARSSNERVIILLEILGKKSRIAINPTNLTHHSGSRRTGS